LQFNGGCVSKIIVPRIKAQLRMPNHVTNNVQWKQYCSAKVAWAKNNCSETVQINSMIPIEHLTRNIKNNIRHLGTWNQSWIALQVINKILSSAQETLWELKNWAGSLYNYKCNTRKLSKILHCVYQGNMHLINILMQMQTDKGKKVVKS
jgi:hypothetical protein